MMKIGNLCGKMMIACLGAVAAGAAIPALAATVSVSGFHGTVYGPGEATLAFTGVDAAQELWVAWDDADKGADISQWKESEQLDTIASGTTSASYRLPDDARPGRAARFFLFPTGGTYPLTYIRSTGTQYIDTGVYPDPHTAVSMTFLLDDMDTRQQRTFGVGDNTNGFVFASYVNGSGLWAWAPATCPSTAARRSRLTCTTTSTRSSRRESPTTPTSSPASRPWPDTRR